MDIFAIFPGSSPNGRKVVELQHTLRRSVRSRPAANFSPAAMESEVRQFAPHERVSRCTLQSYLEGINFEQVAASMVAQVPGRRVVGGIFYSDHCGIFWEGALGCIQPLL